MFVSLLSKRKRIKNNPILKKIKRKTWKQVISEKYHHQKGLKIVGQQVTFWKGFHHFYEFEHLYYNRSRNLNFSIVLSDTKLGVILMLKKMITAPSKALEKAFLKSIGERNLRNSFPMASVGCFKRVPIICPFRNESMK